MAKKSGKNVDSGDIELDLQLIALDEITPYANNPRINEQAVDGVAASIKEFGFNVPIIVDSNGVIVTGHTRYKAAQMLGMSKVPVIFATHLTDGQVNAYRLADNKVAEASSWDAAKLSEELQILQSMGIDLADTGFSMDEITCLIEPVTAECLDDVDHNQVCGDVVSFVANKSSVKFVFGDFNFLVDRKDYDAWRMAKLKELGSSKDVILWLSTVLGLAIKDSDNVKH